jgi:hypothetical protein
MQIINPTPLTEKKRERKMVSKCFPNFFFPFSPLTSLRALSQEEVRPQCENFLTLFSPSISLSFAPLKWKLLFVFLYGLLAGFRLLCDASERVNALE